MKETIGKRKNLSIFIGDNDYSSGSIHGTLKAFPDLRVIFISSHADCNTPKSS